MTIYDDDDVVGEETGYRRYWTQYNRPYPGCGCLYSIVAFLLLWWLCSLVFTPLAIWDAYLFLAGPPLF